MKHEIVHNKHVVADLERKGAITIETLTEVPVLFSAHGSPRAHYGRGESRRITLIDATCPLVTKVHLELLRYLKDGYQVLYIGHHGHIEGAGVLGEAPKSTSQLLKLSLMWIGLLLVIRGKNWCI